MLLGLLNVPLSLLFSLVRGMSTSCVFSVLLYKAATSHQAPPVIASFCRDAAKCVCLAQGAARPGSFWSAAIILACATQQDVLVLMHSSSI